MDKILAGIKIETLKILSRKKTTALMLISALLPGLMAALVLTLQNKTGIMLSSAIGFPIWVLGYFSSIIIPLFIFMWTADSFAGELEDQNLKIILLRPISRFKVYLAKIKAIVICTFINLIMVLCFSELAALFLGILSPGLGSAGGHSIIAYLVSLVPLGFLAIASAFLAQFFKSSSSALITSILVYLAVQVLPIISPLTAKMLPSSYLDWYMLWLGTPVAWEQILLALLFMFGSGFIFLAAGFYIFDRKSL